MHAFSQPSYTRGASEAALRAGVGLAGLGLTMLAVLIASFGSYLP